MTGMSKFWAKLMSDSEHDAVRASFASARTEDDVRQEVREILGRAADRLEVRYSKDPSKVTDAQRRFLSMWFVHVHSCSDGLGWVTDYGPESVSDAVEACGTFGLMKTQKLLESVVSRFGGEATMRDDEAVQAIREADEGELSSWLDETTDAFLELQAEESMLLAQLRAICERPDDFRDA